MHDDAHENAAIADSWESRLIPEGNTDIHTKTGRGKIAAGVCSSVYGRQM